MCRGVGGGQGVCGEIVCVECAFYNACDLLPQAVDVVGQAGKPKSITGFQTHTTPVLLAYGERAELATEECILQWGCGLVSSTCPH